MNTIASLALGLGIVALVFVGFLYFGDRNDTGSSEVAENQQSTMNPNTQSDESQPKVDIEVLTEGTGAVAENGNTLQVHYVGTLEGGTIFDSSRERNEPFSFQLGAGQVIAGWDQALLGMKEGGKRIITIPPELAYGATPPPGIPVNATLIFEVELLTVQK
ncbi:MAG: FKBP-type peptidyl-prolyl cis-trans isomerase [Candidatus Spechtbacterales bacterium]